MVLRHQYPPGRMASLAIGVTYCALCHWRKEHFKANASILARPVDVFSFFEEDTSSMFLTEQLGVGEAQT